MLTFYTRLDVEYLAKILQGYADWLWSLPGTIPEPEGHRDRSRDWDGNAELMEVPGCGARGMAGISGPATDLSK